MTVYPKAAGEYINSVIEKFEKEPSSLSAVERRLVLKYKESESVVNRVASTLNQMRSQIRQAEAQIRSLELQSADAQGKCAGFLDFLVSLKFESDSEKLGTPSEKTDVRDEGKDKPRSTEKLPAEVTAKDLDEASESTQS